MRFYGKTRFCEKTHFAGKRVFARKFILRKNAFCRKTCFPPNTLTLDIFNIWASQYPYGFAHLGYRCIWASSIWTKHFMVKYGCPYKPILIWTWITHEQPAHLTSLPLYTLPKPPSPIRHSCLKFLVAVASSLKVNVCAAMLFEISFSASLFLFFSTSVLVGISARTKKSRLIKP